MKLTATPYTLNLRRARNLQIVLFGAFVFCYFGELQGERIVAFLLQHNVALPFGLLYTHKILAAFLSVLAMGIAYAMQKRYHLPKTWSGNTRLCFFVALSIIFCLLTSPKEQTTLQQKMTRLNLAGQYEEALLVGAKYEQHTPEILAQRIYALSKQSILYDNFFTYTTPLVLHPEEITNENALIFLLSYKLDSLALLLKTKPKAQLQRAEKEALVLYNRLHTSPLYIYKDANTEANYRDFCEYLKKLKTSDAHYSSTEIRNLMNDTYGDTYWHYYFRNKY